ncbi:hypothetical protein K7432_016195, partial [Basidiobolus ranarum]
MSSHPFDNDDIESISDSSSYVDCEAVNSPGEPSQQYVWLQDEEDIDNNNQDEVPKSNSQYSPLASSVGALDIGFELDIESVDSYIFSQQPGIIDGAEPEKTLEHHSVSSLNDGKVSLDEENSSMLDPSTDQTNLVDSMGEELFMDYEAESEAAYDELFE